MRYGSVRFPGKPLAKIAGRPMLEWVIAGVKPLFETLIVATDHKDIAQLAHSFGVEVALTPSNLPSGTDRCFHAIRNRKDIEVVINVQGDEPLIQPHHIQPLIDSFSSSNDVKMATLGCHMTKEAAHSHHAVKIVLNAKGQPLYFSRFAIPYSRALPQQTDFAPHVCLKHIGVYAFTKDFLRQFCEHGPCDLEQAEGLEPLRALYMGVPIEVSLIEDTLYGVDTPEDVPIVEDKLRQRGISQQ